MTLRALASSVLTTTSKLLGRPADEIAAEQRNGHQHDPGVRESAQQGGGLPDFHEFPKDDAHLDQRDDNHARRDDRAGPRRSGERVIYPEVGERQRRQHEPHDQQPLVELDIDHLTTYNNAKMSTQRKSTVCQYVAHVSMFSWSSCSRRAGLRSW